MQAVILWAKLPHLDGTIAERRAQARRYAEVLAGLGLDLPQTLPGYEHSWRNYVIESDHRLGLAERLRGLGIPTSLTYAPPLLLQPVFADRGVRRGDLPVTERFCDRLLGLPIGPQLRRDEID
jgi:dTDP-4-amino-4,6-dideoxygalactose transaminase